MLTSTMARDYIFRIPKCQMRTLALASWRCGDSDQSHQHTVFGNRIVRDTKVVPKEDNDCKNSLLTVLMQEDNYKDAISTEGRASIRSLKGASYTMRTAARVVKRTNLVVTWQ